MWEKRDCLESLFAIIKIVEMEGRQGLPRPKLFFNHLEKMCEVKGLPLTTLCFIKLIEMGEGKGAASNNLLNYNRFRNGKMERAT
jgi:hypothetical protein